MVRLSDAAGFQWVARAVACSQTGPQSAVRDADDDGVRIPPGQVVVDIPLSGLRMGGRVRVTAVWSPSRTCATATAAPAP
ncbi:hypothetical protein GCM10010493_75940 [Streptomyces lavendulae subsp. grasserius]